MLNDPLANVLSKMLNAEKSGKKECQSTPASKVIMKVLEVMKDNMYIGDSEVVEDGRGGIVKINLLGNLNGCGTIKPRFAVPIMNIEKYEKRFLPAKDFGIIIISTPQGIMTHVEAKEKNVGGKLLAYCY